MRPCPAGQRPRPGQTFVKRLRAAGLNSRPGTTRGWSWFVQRGATDPARLIAEARARLAANSPEAPPPARHPAGGSPRSRSVARDRTRVRTIAWPSGHALPGTGLAVSGNASRPGLPLSHDAGRRSSSGTPPRRSATASSATGFIPLPRFPRKSTSDEKQRSATPGSPSRPSVPCRWVCSRSFTTSASSPTWSAATVLES